MAFRSFLRMGAVLCAASLLGGCDGEVQTSTGTAGNAGSGGTGGGTAATGGGGSATTSNTGTAGTGGTGGGGECAAYNEVGCLKAYPNCMPVYDDACCPTCEVGGCADCINIQFHHCEATGSHCADDPPPLVCGHIPDWACKGGKADCPADIGGPEPCHSVAGCIPAYCPTNKLCDPDPVCHPITKGICETLCDSIPPPCPENTYAESDGGCYTGFCIPMEICAGPP